MNQVTAQQSSNKDIKSRKRYDPGVLKQLVIDIAKASEVSETDAEIFADALVEADLQGTSTHGISRLNIYIQRIQKGLIDPSAKLNIEHQNGSTLVVDAGNGLGQVQATKTLDRLISIAKENGVGVSTIRNSQHFGALSYYCNQAVEHDMILFATTNCEPSMSPEGGCEAYFGTNPLASSFPSGKGYPVKIDLATSRVARGNIIAAEKRNDSIPSNWAQTADGESTTDPQAALAGTMLPMADHKGYALALMVEVFSGVLSGSAIGPDVGSMYKDLDRKQDVGHFFCLMDISAFMDVKAFKQRIDKTIEGIKSCQKRPDADEIWIPGERSHLRAQKNRKEGVLVEDATRNELKSLCEKLDVEYRLD